MSASIALQKGVYIVILDVVGGQFQYLSLCSVFNENTQILYYLVR
jgi:hypothetical protein